MKVPLIGEVAIPYACPCSALIFALLVCCTSCDRGDTPSRQGVLVQNGQAYEISIKSVSDTNMVRIASRVDSAGSKLSGTEWIVARSNLLNQPRWDGISSEPPLSAQKACGLALPDVRKRFPEVSNWAVDSIYLRNLLVTDIPEERSSFRNVWVYEVQFAPKDLATKQKFDREVGVQPVTQVVLLDGTIVQPQNVPPTPTR